MKQTFSVLALASLAAGTTLLSAAPASAERLRDLTEIVGARENQVIGYGIVTGLSGTGDDISVPFAAQSLQSLMRRMGVQVDPKQLRLRNVAAVLVTTSLPAFAKPGTKLDISVSSIGNARSLQGGVLVQTLLKGSDQKTYAVAQGPLLVGGFEATGMSGSSARQGNLNSGRIPGGAIVEREIPTEFVNNNAVRLSLRVPSFGLAANVAEAVDKAFGAGTAIAQDGGGVLIRMPDTFASKPVELIAALENVEVTPVRRARVVVSERTGTIVASGDVRLAPVAVVHGGLTIVVKETPLVSQPLGAFTNGTTEVVSDSNIQTSEGDKALRYIPASPTLADVAAALGTLGLSPRELTSVLQALRGAGALEAELVVQ